MSETLSSNHESEEVNEQELLELVEKYFLQINSGSDSSSDGNFEYISVSGKYSSEYGQVKINIDTGEIVRTIPDKEIAPLIAYIERSLLFHRTHSPFSPKHQVDTLSLRFLYEAGLRVFRIIDAERVTERRARLSLSPLRSALLANEENRICSPTTTPDQNYSIRKDAMLEALEERSFEMFHPNFSHFLAGYRDFVSLILRLKDRVFSFENASDPLLRSDPDCFVFETHTGRVTIAEFEKGKKFHIYLCDNLQEISMQLVEGGDKTLPNYVIYGDKKMSIHSAIEDPNMIHFIRVVAADLYASYADKIEPRGFNGDLLFDEYDRNH